MFQSFCVGWPEGNSLSSDLRTTFFVLQSSYLRNRRGPLNRQQLHMTAVGARLIGLTKFGLSLDQRRFSFGLFLQYIWSAWWWLEHVGKLFQKHLGIIITIIIIIPTDEVLFFRVWSTASTTNQLLFLQACMVVAWHGLHIHWSMAPMAQRYKVVPPFSIAKLVQIIPITVTMVDGRYESIQFYTWSLWTNKHNVNREHHRTWVFNFVASPFTVHTPDLPTGRKVQCIPGLFAGGPWGPWQGKHHGGERVPEWDLTYHTVKPITEITFSTYTCVYIHPM